MFLVDGRVTQLQAYQMLRNCGKELMYESPQSRTDTAHVIWDKLLAAGMIETSIGVAATCIIKNSSNLEALLRVLKGHPRKNCYMVLTGML